MKLPTHGAGLPGNVDMITGSVLTPLRESVTALPAPAYRQEAGASSRLARDPLGRLPHESLDRCCRIVSLCNIMVKEGLSSFKGGSMSSSCPRDLSVLLVDMSAVLIKTRFTAETLRTQRLTGKCPVNPALEGGGKGHNIKGKYLTGKPPLFRAWSFTFLGFPHLFSCHSCRRQEKNLMPLRSLRLCGADLIWNGHLLNF